MQSKTGKGLATACGLAALLALGACGDRGTESAAQRDARNEATSVQPGSASPAEQAAAREAQRSGAAELSQGSGT